MRVGLKPVRVGLKPLRVGLDASLVESDDVLGRLKLAHVRLDLFHLQSAALLVQSDAHVFQSAKRLGGLKIRLVRSDTALVGLKKPEVESDALGIQSAAFGIQSNERGFQSAMCLCRLAMAERLAIAPDFATDAARRLFAPAGDVKATPRSGATSAMVEATAGACGQPEEKAGCVLVDGPADNVGAVTNPRPPSADPLVAPHSPRHATPRNLLARAVLHGVHRLYRH